MDDLSQWIGEHVTREGRKAAVTHVDGGPVFPLIGWRFAQGGYRTAATWTAQGRFTSEGGGTVFDLMPPAPKIVVSDAVRAAYGRSTGWSGLEVAITEWLRETSPEDVAAIHAAVREGRL